MEQGPQDVIGEAIIIPKGDMGGRDEDQEEEREEEEDE